jgi:hypothetical protein
MGYHRIPTWKWVENAQFRACGGGRRDPTGCQGIRRANLCPPKAEVALDTESRRLRPVQSGKRPGWSAWPRIQRWFEGVQDGVLTCRRRRARRVDLRPLKVRAGGLRMMWAGGDANCGKVTHPSHLTKPPKMEGTWCIAHASAMSTVGCEGGAFLGQFRVTRTIMRCPGWRRSMRRALVPLCLRRE